MPKCSWINPRIILFNLRMNFLVCFPFKEGLLLKQCKNAAHSHHEYNKKPRRVCIWSQFVDEFRANFPNWNSTEYPFKGYLKIWDEK